MSVIKDLKIEKVATGIEGFDLISYGGLPKNRTTLVAGSAGSAKTIFSAQFLVEGIKKSGENGVFVTFEESPEEIKRNMLGFGWDIQKLETEGKLTFVDGSPQPGEETVETGSYDLGALMARIEHAVKKINASRVSLDSLGAIFSQFSDVAVVRKELFRIAYGLKDLNVTAILTAERTQEYGDIARFGIEEFVADNVIIIRNVLIDEKRRRTMEILKFRGTTHQKGEFPFTIIPCEGLIIMPLSAIQLKQESSNIRIHSGNSIMDNMCSGGFFRDSIILISGATGTGKTLLATEFIKGGASNGERCLLFAFEESRAQLMRNAQGWGIDYKKFENEEKLKIVCKYPEVIGLEDHLVDMKSVVDEFKPNRIVVDSLSALERVSTTKSYREFVIGLTSFIKHKEAAGLFTATTPTLIGGVSITEAHISTITDSIILLRYVEMYGEMKRGITVLKMRGSMHEKEICEFNIDSDGMHIGEAFRNVTGILTGQPIYGKPKEKDRLSEMFTEEKV